MGRYQSIISAIISAICIFVLPWLQKKGIILDEDSVTTIVVGIIAFIAFLWTAWRNHNLTEAALEAQCVLDELKSGEDVPDEELEAEAEQEEEEE